MVRELEVRCFWLATWFDDWLDIELPALLVSLTVHGVLLISLGFVGYQVHRQAQREFESRVVDNLVMTGSPFQDLDQAASPPASEPTAGSFADPCSNDHLGTYLGGARSHLVVGLDSWNCS